MNTKNTIIVIILSVLVFSGVYGFLTFKNSEMRYANVGGSSTGTQTGEGKLKVANFSGKLSEVNTGCFADGECYVVIDGKHITTTLGWRQEILGTIQGVESLGDMENYIGRDFEVYVQDKGDGTYTLYGSEGFYIKLK